MLGNNIEWDLLTLFLLLYLIVVAMVLYLSIISETALPQSDTTIEKIEIIKKLEEKFGVRIKVSRLTSNAKIIGCRYIFISPILYRYLSTKSLKYIKVLPKPTCKQACAAPLSS